MRKLLLYVFLTLFLLPSCSKRSGSTATVVKPKYHHRWYDRKKDKRTKRTKSLRVQSWHGALALSVRQIWCKQYLLLFSNVGVLRLAQSPHHYINISPEKDLRAAELVQVCGNRAAHEYRCKQVCDIPSATGFGYILFKDSFQHKLFKHLLDGQDLHWCDGSNMRKEQFFLLTL